MFIKEKTIKILKSIIFSILSLSSFLYGAKLKERVLSSQEALRIRQTKGEYLIPYGNDSWYKAIIISYLYNESSQKRKNQQKKRVDNLKITHSNSGFFSRMFLGDSIFSQNIGFYSSKNNYIYFYDDNKKTFDNFLAKMKLNLQSISIFEKIQKVANILQMKIQLYKPSRKAYQLDLVNSFYPTTKASGYPYIYIVQDNYVHDDEKDIEYMEYINYKKSYNNKKRYHYRALLNDPATWKFKNESKYISELNKSKFSESKISDTLENENQLPTNQLTGYYNENQFHTSMGEGEPANPALSYNPDQIEMEVKKGKVQQVNRFKNITEKLHRLLINSIKNFEKGLEVYHIEQVSNCMHFYKMAEESSLINSINKYSSCTLPSTKKLISHIVKVIDTIKKEVKKVDFTSQAYQKQSKSKKMNWFILLNKKLYFSLAASQKMQLKELGSNQASFPAIKRILMLKIGDIQDNVNQLLGKDLLTEEECEELNSFFQTCDIFCDWVEQEEFDEEKKEIKKHKKIITDYLAKKVRDMLEKSHQNIDDHEALANILIENSIIEKSIDKAYMKGTDIENMVEKTLKLFKKKNGDQSIIRLNELAIQLRKNPIGGQIVAQNAAFRGISIMLRNTAFNSIGIEAILRDILEYQVVDHFKDEEKVIKSKIDEYCLDELGDAYDLFKNRYWDLVETYLGEPNATLTILSLLKKDYINEDQISTKIKWSNTIRQKIPDILSYLFAYWTLRNAQYYKEAKGVTEKERKKYLLQPHPAQVIAIMRILGVGKKEKLKNHLIQIGTGEGKSVVTFAAAVTLAFMGFDVSCVCYSEYLSLRDHNEFMPLLQELGVDRYIRYTTFNNLCESIINEKVDVRDGVVKLIKERKSNNNNQYNFNDFDDEIKADSDDEIKTDSDDEKKTDSDDEKMKDNMDEGIESTLFSSGFYKNSQKSELAPGGTTTYNSSRFKFSPERARILFIDEVDVFFNKDFYGSPYSPTALVQDPSITELLHFVWNNRKKISYTQVISSKEYYACIDTFKKWKPIINEAVKSMVVDVKNFDSPPYIVHDSKLCYKERDGISSKLNYQYKTAFACLNEKHKITKENLQDHLGIYLNCGIFSYAEVPYKFDRILGVTGTLESLTSVELSILKKSYNITQHTYMPSLYGKSNRKFYKNSSKGLKIIEKDYYTSMLKSEIMKSLQGGSQNPNDKRAVIVFFETPEKLDEFYSDQQIEALKEHIIIMKSDLSFEEKGRCISKAVIAGNITFSIREFGRGTDFVCYDPTVNKNGGVHVIITFFPENISEETQIIGRTARQRNEGSVSMVLESGSIESLINKNEIEAIRNISADFYTPLNKSRNKIFESNYKDSIQYVNLIREQHKKAIQFTENLLKANIQKVTEHLLTYNTAPLSSSRITRTIVLMDATGSMGQLLSKAQKKVETMFERINAALQESQKKSFSLQFVAYRNYNAPPHMLLQVSPWESAPQNIVSFMRGVLPRYGMGNEAIEVGLAHALREHNKKPIHQIILIGDMPPNTLNEVVSRRNTSTTQWDNETLYSQPTYYQDEIKKLKEANIPVHAFCIPTYNKSKTEKAFKEIATLTGGNFQLLDIHSKKGAEQLTDIVSLEVLKETGGTEAVENYKKLFGVEKSYLSNN